MSAVGWILAPGLALALWLPGAAAAETRTGQSPDCKRFCMKVEPRVGPEGSVFRFTGRGWRPRKQVTVEYGAYCRPDEACPMIGYIGFLRTDRRGRFSFRLRAGAERPFDGERRIASGAGPTFSQRLRERTVRRAPRYRVVVPAE